MELCLFSAKAYDRDSFDAANARFGHDLHYIEARLGPATAVLAPEGGVVCPFVNDDVVGQVLAGLAERGVRGVALRSAGYNNVDLDAAARARHRRRAGARVLARTRSPSTRSR